MSRLAWLKSRRTRQLIDAATEGRLYYDTTGILRHRSDGSRESDLAAHKRDAEIVGDLITTGRLCLDEWPVVGISVVVPTTTTAGAP